MTSSIPYNPEGFGDEDNNPFATSDSLSGSQVPDPIPAIESSKPTRPTMSSDRLVGEEAVIGVSPPPQPKPVKRKQIKEYKLTVKITSVERHGKKDPIFRFDAHTNLPRFRTSTFKDVRRTHHEFIKFFEYLNGANPECFVPSVPPSHTSAGIGTEENEIKVKRNMQQWLDRVTNNQILIRDEEFVFFIESDFGYTPVNKKKPPATGLMRKTLKQFQTPYDETELATFRPLVKQIYLQTQEAHTKLEKSSKARRSFGLAETDFGNKLTNFTNLELVHPGMANMWKKLGKTIQSVGDIDLIKSTAEQSTLGDVLLWISKDSYVAKESMTNRYLIMRELIKAQANTKSKHSVAQRLKASSSINPLKVDEAINSLDEATRYEEGITRKVNRVTENMLLEKDEYLKQVENMFRGNIAEMVQRTIEAERRTLSVWESIRLDVRAVDTNGGLSRLGREGYPKQLRPSSFAQSQGPKGDSWSGDRTTRAVSINTKDIVAGDSYQDSTPNDDIGEEENNVVDARNAASLLAGSTF